MTTPLHMGQIVWNPDTLARKQQEILGKLKKNPGDGGCSIRLILATTPGILAVVACLIGVVVLNVFQQHYLSIALAVGCLASGYSIYQGYQSHLQKTLRENMEILFSLIQILNTAILELQANNVQYKQENEKLSHSNKQLENTVERLEKESGQFADSNKELRHNLSDLQSTHQKFEEKGDLQSSRLEALTTSLNGIKEAVEKDHSQFSHNLDKFFTEVQKLQETSSALVSVDTRFEKTMATLMHMLEILRSIFIVFDQWKRDQYIARQIQMQQTLQLNITELNKQLTRSEKINSKEEKEIEEIYLITKKIANFCRIIREESIIT